MNKAVSKFLENDDYTIDDLLNEYETSGEISMKTDNAINPKDVEEEKEDDLLQPGGLVGLGEEEDEEESESKDDEDQDDEEEVDECKDKKNK